MEIRTEEGGLGVRVRLHRGGLGELSSLSGRFFALLNCRRPAPLATALYQAEVAEVARTRRRCLLSVKNVQLDCEWWVDQVGGLAVMGELDVVVEG